MTNRLPMRMRRCEECHKIFQAKNTLARYCSPHCGQKVWARNHRGYMVEAQRRYLTNPIHKEKRRAYQKEYRERSKSKNRERVIRNERYKKDPEYRYKIKAYVRAQRQRYRVSHTREQWEALKEIYGNRCAYCGRKMRRLSKDHIIPISQGNPETVDKIENILPACKSCNSRKHTSMPSSYQIILATEVIMPGG